MAFTPPAALGAFTFDAPYGTRGIRLTNSSNALQGVQPRLYPYWSSINNHAGRPDLFVFLGRLGQTPLILVVNKSSGQVRTLRELPWVSTGEGNYWSDTDPDRLYFTDSNRLNYFVATGDKWGGYEVFSLLAKHGNNLWQAHSSGDDQVHSATVRRTTTSGPYEVLGCVVFTQGRQTFFPRRGEYDECQIDKSGRWLVIQEDHGNRIVHLADGTSRTITNAEGALSHIDCGDGFMCGENDQGAMWTMDRLDLATLTRTERYRGSGPWRNGMGHVSIRGNTALLSANADNELLTVDLTTGGARPLAPGMIDGSDYDHQLRANLDPTGEYACYVAHVDGRFDAFLVQLPAATPPIVVRPPDPKPKPEPGGSMKPFPYFTSAAKVELEHDSGFTSAGAPGTFDGRPAHILPTVDTLPEGNGAWVALTWANGKTLRQHGRLYLKQEPDRATFAVDMTEEPQGFR